MRRVFFITSILAISLALFVTGSSLAASENLVEKRTDTAESEDRSALSSSPPSPTSHLHPIFFRYPPPESPAKIKELAVAEHQVCALTHGGLAACWALEPDIFIEAPRDLLASLSAGAGHFCALDLTSRAFCWGDDSSNQLAAPGDLIIDIASGTSHSCALDASGTPLCWGALDGEHRDPPSGPFNMITAGGDKTCASGAWEPSRCWGINAPSEPFDELIKDLTMSSDIICALDLSNRPICHFDPGTNAFEPPSPLAVDIAVGQGFVCTLDPAGGLTCDGPRAPNLPSSPPISRLIDASETTLCVLTVWEEVMCWDQHGKLGGGD